MKTHPGIDDCAVVGRRNHAAEELPAAFVVRNPQHINLSSSEIRQFVSGKLDQISILEVANSKRLTSSDKNNQRGIKYLGKVPEFRDLKGGVYFVKDIPRGVTGNVLRRKLDQRRMTVKELIPLFTPSPPPPTPLTKEFRKQQPGFSGEKKSPQAEAKINEKFLR